MGGLLGASGMEELAPGGEVQATILYNRLFDMTLVGKYVLEAAKPVRNLRTGADSTVVSNRIVIEVMD